MIIKTFTGKTEEEAIAKAKEKLGENILITNIKKYSKKSLFKKTTDYKVEIIVAIKENINKKNELEIKQLEIKQKEEKEEYINKLNSKENDAKTLEQEEKIKILKNQIDKSNTLISTLTRDILTLNEDKKNEISFSNQAKQEVFQKLKEENVIEPLAYMLVENINEDEIDINICKKIVYNKIIDIIGKAEQINTNVYLKKKKKKVLFLGPTGVGKTTTIAKLASKFTIEENLVVGLITADTYRIAAVEQLKTYADILNTEIVVAYDNRDLLVGSTRMKKTKDLILIDTAGRSHRNNSDVNELVEIVNILGETDIYLTLSLTTKTEDLVDIIQTYEKYFNFKILFTKADETLSYGAILNISYITKKKMSYITNGQNVPHDVLIMNAEIIAKSILGIREI